MYKYLLFVVVVLSLFVTSCGQEPSPALAEPVEPVPITPPSQAAPDSSSVVASPNPTIPVPTVPPNSIVPKPTTPATPCYPPGSIVTIADQGIIVAVFTIDYVQHTIVSTPTKTYVILGDFPQFKVGDLVENFVGEPAGALPIFNGQTMGYRRRMAPIPTTPEPSKDEEKSQGTSSA